MAANERETAFDINLYKWSDTESARQTITISMASDYFNVLIISLIFTLLMLSLEILKARNIVNLVNCNIISEVKPSASCVGKIVIIGSFIAWHISYTKLNDENMKFTHKFGNITFTHVWYIIIGLL